MDKVKEFVSNHKLPVIAGGVGLLFVIIILLAVAGASRGSRGAAPVNSGVEGLLRVGIVVGNDRYASKDGEAVTGIEPDLAKRAADIEGVTLDTTMYATVETAVSALQSGSIDVILGRISSADPAVTGLALSDPYGWSGLYFLAPRNDFTDNLAQMGGKTLGILAPVAETAKTIPYIEAIISTPYTDLTLLAQDVIQGNIDLGVVGERDALAMVSEHLQAQEILNGPQERYVAVAPGNTLHLAAVNMAISQWFDDRAAEE
ncbi:MAG: transporter substrate-binding domain-containing protein [Lachnospiraceae bacterium]|nr:transporter substrate-binding domain-containing protein [Lachnospiraceae bacterium]